MTSANALAAFSVILLEYGERYLLLQRAGSKKIHPSRWTGLGGRVEPDEWADLRSSAWRELLKETGLTDKQVHDFSLRRVLLMRATAGNGLTILLYFTGHLSNDAVPNCTEGTLHWLNSEEFAALDIIESSKDTLSRLPNDMRSDPHGKQSVKVGFFANGQTIWEA